MGLTKKNAVVASLQLAYKDTKHADIKSAATTTLRTGEVDKELVLLVVDKEGKYI